MSLLFVVIVVAARSEGLTNSLTVQSYIHNKQKKQKKI